MTETSEKLVVYGILAPFVFALILKVIDHYFESLKYPSNQGYLRRVQSLRKRDYPSAYESYLRAILGGMDRILGSYSRPPKSGYFLVHVKSALTSSSYNTIFFIAIIYPTLFLLGGWVYGNSASLGLLELLQEKGLYERAVVGLSLILMCITKPLFWYIDNMFFKTLYNLFSSALVIFSIILLQDAGVGTIAVGAAFVAVVVVILLDGDITVVSLFTIVICAAFSVVVATLGLIESTSLLVISVFCFAGLALLTSFGGFLVFSLIVLLFFMYLLFSPYGIEVDAVSGRVVDLNR